MWYARIVNRLLMCMETIKLYCRAIVMKWCVFNLLLFYLFWCRECGNIIIPCCLIAFKNVLCRTNRLILCVLLMVNSGAEPKDILSAKTYEENYFTYYLSFLTFVHDGFKITPFPVRSFSLIFLTWMNIWMQSLVCEILF